MWGTAALKSTVHLGLLTVLMVLVGRLFGGTGGMVMPFVLALVMNFSAHWY